MSSWGRFTRDLIDQWPLVLSGLSNTILLAIVITITGFLLGVFVFYFAQSKSFMIRKITHSYISFFIGMPLIVLLFLLYFGLPQWGVQLSPFFVALLGFTFNIAAYNASYLMTAFNGLNSVELDAAQAQGFSHPQIFCFVILPQVLRSSVPALTNQVIRNLKDTSIVFLIQFTEFFSRLQEVAATNFQFLWAYSFAAFVHLILVSVVVVFATILEKKLAALYPY